jgi:hypothetical protein
MADLLAAGHERSSYQTLVLRPPTLTRH